MPSGGVKKADGAAEAAERTATVAQLLVYLSKYVFQQGTGFCCFAVP